jgi:NADH-quinone oxidoreductase subunit H
MLAVYIIVNFLLLLVPVLVAIAFFTLCERKFMSAMQRRMGPNVVGSWGLLQPVADGVKLMVKETIIPQRANLFLFFLAPVLRFSLSLLNWTLLPISSRYTLVNPELSLILFFSVSSLGVYGLIFSGWSSNSKYPLLASLRASAQMLSYEIAFGLILFLVAYTRGSFNFFDIVLRQKTLPFVFFLLPLTVVFMISILAETNRTPFDLVEAEAELVSGFTTEYSGVNFAIFFLAEYSNMLVLSGVTRTMFFRTTVISSSIFFASFIYRFKVCLFVFYFIWVRATFPRFRYDQLMYVCWKNFLPVVAGYLWLVVVFVR